MFGGYFVPIFGSDDGATASHEVPHSKGVVADRVTHTVRGPAPPVVDHGIVPTTHLTGARAIIVVAFYDPSEELSNPTDIAPATSEHPTAAHGPCQPPSAMDDQDPAITLPPGPLVGLAAGCVNIVRILLHEQSTLSESVVATDHICLTRFEGHRTRTQVTTDSKYSFASVVLGMSIDPILPTEVVPVVMSTNHPIKIDSTVVRKRTDMCKFSIIGRVILSKGESSESPGTHNIHLEALLLVAPHLFG